MKTKFLIISIIALAVIVAILTNPKPEVHKEALKNKLYQYMHGPMTYDLNNARTRQEEVVQMFDILLGNTLLESVIDNLVTSDNYLIFSLTRLSLEGNSKIIGYGIFGNVYLDKNIDDLLNEAFSKTKTNGDSIKKRKRGRNSNK
jgi:hypothetical protein